MIAWANVTVCARPEQGLVVTAMIFRYVTKESTDAAQCQALDAGGDPHETALSAVTGRPVPLPRPRFQDRPADPIREHANP